MSDATLLSLLTSQSQLAEDKCRLDRQMAGNNDDSADETLNAVAGPSSTGLAVGSMETPSIAPAKQNSDAGVEAKQNSDAGVEAKCIPRSSAGLVEMGMEELRNLVSILRSDLLEQQASRGEKLVHLSTSSCLSSVVTLLGIQ